MKFDINKIVKDFQPDIETLAKILYPKNQYPVAAFDRILSGKAELSSSQIIQLADFLQVDVKNLFTLSENDEPWKGTASKNDISLTKGKYRVELFHDGDFLILYKNNIEVYREISCAYSMTLGDFITYLNNLIKIYQ